MFNEVVCLRKSRYFYNRKPKKTTFANPMILVIAAVYLIVGFMGINIENQKQNDDTLWIANFAEVLNVKKEQNFFYGDIHYDVDGTMYEALIVVNEQTKVNDIIDIKYAIDDPHNVFFIEVSEADMETFGFYSGIGGIMFVYIIAMFIRKVFFEK